MSAYVLSDDKFSKIVTLLDHLTNKTKYPEISVVVPKQYDGILAGLNMCEYKGGLVVTDTKALGKALHRINFEAVSQRYKDYGAYSENENDFSFVSTGLESNNLESAKRLLVNLDCLLYQCAEGDIFESKEYQALRAIQHAVAYAIASNLTKDMSWN